MKESICLILPSGGVHYFLFFFRKKRSCRFVMKNIHVVGCICKILCCHGSFIRSTYFFVGQNDRPCSRNLKCSSESL